MDAIDLQLLEKAIEIARHARQCGNHPFGALLTDENRNILLTAENTVNTEKDCTGHAETNLMRLASHRYDPAFLSQCSLYSSAEPCPMCTGAIYWGGVGRIVYGLSELDLLDLTGNHSDNPTLSLTCREVIASGQRNIVVEGPVDLASARDVHHNFWC